ncbi:MAG: hypothetical protein Fur0018_20970 [Anaerolineales bacterium]
MEIPGLEPHQILQQAFPGILRSEADELARAGRVQVYPPDTILCREGAVEDTFYIILEGEVRVTKIINDEEVRLLKHLYTGDFFGEMALIHNAPRAATVQTVRPTQVLSISKEDFERVLQNSSSMSMAMVREVSRRLRENDEMAIDSLRTKATELSAAYQRLAEEEFARREFLTTIAHELRTPLTAANGFVQVAQQPSLDAATRAAALETVDRNLQKIITLVNDILFLQEIDLIFSEFQPTDIGELILSLVDSYRSRAEQNGVRLQVEIAPNIPRLPADSKTLQRAFSALLDNAIKFSPDGGDVFVQAVVREDVLQIIFHDTGIGIPPKILPHIFDRFFHTDELGGYLFGGVGLGLSIARQVVEQHGGHIHVQSAPGKGSIFVIELKLQRPEAG